MVTLTDTDTQTHDDTDQIFFYARADGFSKTKYTVYTHIAIGVYTHIAIGVQRACCYLK